MVAMDNDFRWFRSTVTGKTGKYPSRFASRESFEPVDSEDAGCLDCLPKEEPVEQENDTQVDDVWSTYFTPESDPETKDD
jgi:hypothetical protein